MVGTGSATGLAEAVGSVSAFCCGTHRWSLAGRRRRRGLWRCGLARVWKRDLIRGFDYDFRDTAIRADGSCGTGSLAFPTSRLSAEFRQVFSPYKNGENLVGIGLVEIEECWGALALRCIPGTRNDATNRRFLANVVFSLAGR